MTKQRSTFEAVDQVSAKNKAKTKVQIKLQALSYVMLDPKVLKPNQYNPNRQTDEEFALLKHSIETDGFTLPVVANLDNTIIDGEHRWRAALALELKAIPVVVLDLDETRMKLSTIRHNKARGSHDADLEALIYKDLEQLMGRDFITSQLMVDDNVLDEILNFESAPMDLASDEFGDSWTPVSNEAVVDKNAEGKPEDRPIFTTRATVDRAMVFRSPTPLANLASFNKATNQGGETPSLYTLTGVMNQADGQVVAEFLERADLKGDTPAEKLYWFLLDRETQ